MDRIGALETEERLDSLLRAGVDVLPLSGAPKVPFPEHVMNAARDSLFQSATRLPSRGLPELRQALAAWLSEEWARTIDPEAEVLVTNGAMQALRVTLSALLPRGARVVVPTPAFFFSGLLESAGLLPSYVAGTPENGWRWELEQMAGAIEAGTRAILLCNPENPTGFVPNEEQVLGVVDLAARHRLILIVDESYERFVYESPRLASFGRLSTWQDTVVVRSMSKSFALSSWRVGYVVARPALLDACLRVFEWDTIRCNHVSQAVAAATVSGPQRWMQTCVEQYRESRELALRSMPRELQCVAPAGAAFLFINLGVPPALVEEAESQLMDMGIPLVPGRHFQAPGYVRIPFGGTKSALPELGRRLARWMRARNRCGQIEVAGRRN